MSLIGNHMSHAPLRVLDITLVAGDDVNVDMKNTLPRCRPHVNADVVAVGLELLIQQSAFLGYQCHAGVDLLGRQIKKTGNMPTRDDQCMTRAYRVGIAGTVSKFILQ